MFLSKGLDFLLGKKQTIIDINNLPDIDNQDDIKTFLNSIKQNIKDWINIEESKVIIEFLVEISEKYNIIEYISDVWVDTLNNSFNTEILQNMLDITLNTAEKNNKSFIINVIYTQNFDFLDFLWKVLEQSSNSMQKFTVLKILQTLSYDSCLPTYLSKEPNRVNYLLDTLKEPSEFLRNGKIYTESILLIKKIADNDKDISKLLAFQGIFEILAEIMRNEDIVIVEDCMALMNIMMTDFNKNYIRELPCVYSILSDLVLTSSRDSALKFLVKACTIDGNTVYVPNQKHFSKMIDKVIHTAYPLAGDQSKLGLKVLSILASSNPTATQSLLKAENSDLLDAILTHCSLDKNSEENLGILWRLVNNNTQISENFISHVTCTPGYEETQGTLPIFNYLLQKTISTKSINLPNLCQTLELLLYSNDSAKQLAEHLPIDLNSGTVMNKMLGLWIEELGVKGPYVFILSRLFIVWVYDSPSTANKIVAHIYNYLPQILSYLDTSGLDTCLVSLFVGLICLYCNPKEIDSVLIKKTGYSEMCNKIEYLNTLHEFTKISNTDTYFSHDKYSYPLVKVYKLAVQAVKMHLLKQITESVPEDQKELAKLIEAQEAVISMHYLKKNNSADAESLQLLKKIKTLESEIQEKNIKIEELNTTLINFKYEKTKETRTLIQTMISMNEKIDLVEFENLSLKRENNNLYTKIERLLEEIKTYSTKKHEVHADLKLIEAKENLKIQTNEVKYLKEILNKKESEYREAVEIIGKQELKLLNVPATILDDEIVGVDSLNMNKLRFQLCFSGSFNGDKSELKSSSTQTEKIELIQSYSPAEAKPVDWLNGPESISDNPISFFDNLPQNTTINSLFQ